MKKILILSLVLGSLFVSCKKPLMDETNCFMSFEEAKKEAKSSKKDILVIISQDESEQSVASSIFKEKVLTNPEFIDFAKDNFVLYRMDYSPSNTKKSAYADDATKKEIKIAKKYESAFEEGRELTRILEVPYPPSFYVLSKDALFVCKVEYFEPEFNAKSFILLLQECQMKSQELNQKVAAVKKGSKEDRIKALDDLYTTSNNAGRTLLKDLITDTVKIDSNNKTGLNGKFIYYKLSTDANEFITKQQYQKAIDLYEKSTEYDYLDSVYKQQSFYMIAYIGQMSELFSEELSYDYLRKAYDAAPDSQIAPYIKMDLDAYEEMTKNREAEKAATQENTTEQQGTQSE